jgi:hypothetical protein
MSLEENEPNRPTPRRPGPFAYLALGAAVALAALGWQAATIIALLAVIARIADNW